jgi:acetolactate decarboxylase
MKNVMHKGELFATIDVDTLQNKTHLYALGPLEYLRGEIMIVDGKGYTSAVRNNKKMHVKETMKIRAPFLGYAHIEQWQETQLPDSILNSIQLENYLGRIAGNFSGPFLFRLTAFAESADIHVVNLPKGTSVSSPEEAHQGQQNYLIDNTTVEMLGFYSTQHKAIFTHHDTNMHIHLMTSDKKKMGHLEAFKIRAGTARLYLPV